MKLFHISDLHIGIRVHEMPMTDDQKHILNEIITYCKAQKPDALIIAGDIYDKPVPSAEAVQVFDTFLTELKSIGITVFAISGNHDSAERVAFASSIMSASNIYMSPVYDGEVLPVTLSDEYGDINIYMLPFIKPLAVRRFFDEEITSYDDAVRKAVLNFNIDTSKRNVLVAHQFVTGAVTSKSEEINVGGTDNISADIFKDFDYTALGHIHRPQRISSDYIRYSGTPLKYSFSECCDEKSITVIELHEKGNTSISFLPLTPLHDMREIKGTYEFLTDRKNYVTTNTDDYLHITLTDEEDVPYAMEKLRVIYKNIMCLDYDNTRTRHKGTLNSADITKEKTPLELFSLLFEKQNGTPMNEDEISCAKEFMEEVD